MQITKGTDYAIRGVIALARRAPGTLVMGQDIAEQEHLPVGFLAKLFRHLSVGEVLKSSRGARGGFMLARTPDQISLWDIIVAVEGRDKISPCLGEFDDCDQHENCHLREVMSRAQAALEDIFKSTSIADILAKETKPVADQ
jgi:Rrf2 family protein